MQGGENHLASGAWPHSPPDCVRKGRHYAGSSNNAVRSSVVGPRFIVGSGLAPPGLSAQNNAPHPRWFVSLYHITQGAALLSIPPACSRLRRSPNLVCVVEPALCAGSTTHTKLFAQRSCASTQRERAKSLSIRHALRCVSQVKRNKCVCRHTQV